jgi:hypothetical protein
VPTVSLAPQTIAATTNGASLDIRSLVKQGSRFLVVVSIGTLTDGGYTPSVQDSADDSSFAALTPFAGSFVEVTTANDPLTQAVSIVPVTGRPFLRVVITESTAGVTGGPMAAYIIPVPTHV